MKRVEPQVGPSLNNVLFATDFSPAAEATFPYAAAMSDRYQSKLYIAHVINLDSFDLLESESARITLQKAHDEAQKKITQLLDPLHLPPDRYDILVADGAIAEVLVDLIQRNHIDLAIIGTHGRRAFKKLLMGSIAQELVLMAPCPVLTVGPKTASVPRMTGLQHILYPVEFAPDNSKAAEYAVSLAERYSASLTVMNVREDMPTYPNMTEEHFNQPFEHWIRDHVPTGSDLRNRIRFERGFGSAPSAILDFVAKSAVDIIVISVRQQDPVMAAHLPKADTAYELVTLAPCPVLTIR